MSAPMIQAPPTLALRGVSLIELLVGIAILAVALALGVPSFAEWINNSQIRSTAESLQNGLNQARAEAVRRNAVVRLQLTDKLDNGCALSSSGTSWVINMSSSVSPAPSCGATVDDATSPFILEKGSAVSSRASATVNAFGASPQSTIAFNGLGRVAPTTNPDFAVGALTIDVQSSRGTCVAASGKMRCLRLVVTPGGQVRMCDPARPSGDPMTCP